MKECATYLFSKDNSTYEKCQDRFCSVVILRKLIFWDGYIWLIIAKLFPDKIKFRYLIHIKELHNSNVVILWCLV